MRNLLSLAIASIIFSITDAKYLPVRVRQSASTTTPAVLILRQNPGCCLLSSALSVCTSLTPGFTTLAPSQQAPCLCYSSTVWAPDVFDNAVKTCADFVSTAFSPAYTPMYNLENFCSNVGNAHGPVSASATSPASNSACSLVDSLIQACGSQSPGFATLSAPKQASCLCYISISTWMPTIFDNAVSTCVEFAKTAETVIYPVVQSLSGFCDGVGNILTTGVMTTTTIQSFTTLVPPSAVRSAGSVPSQTPPTASTTSTAVTIIIGGAGTATNTATVDKNGAMPKGVSEAEVILISFLCAAVVLFLC